MTHISNAGIGKDPHRVLPSHSYFFFRSTCVLTKSECRLDQIAGYHDRNEIVFVLFVTKIRQPVSYFGREESDGKRKKENRKSLCT